MSDPTGDLHIRSVQGYGWIPDVPDNRDQLFSASGAVMANLPQKVDLRQHCPSVYDQGQLGSCTANAIGGAFEFDQLKQGLTDFMPSRLFIYYNERTIEGTVDSDSGAMIRDGMKSVNKLGVCPETEWSYDIAKFRDKPTDNCFTDAAKHQALVYRSVVQDLHQIQGCLASGYPVVFGFSVYESFEGKDVARSGVVPLPKKGEKQLGGHAVLAVGYDDTTQSFTVRNSWGSAWGQGGYFTMPYAYMTSSQLASDFWALYTVEQ
jgi:C1A family cysteine protease